MAHSYSTLLPSGKVLLAGGTEARRWRQRSFTIRLITPLPPRDRCMSPEAAILRRCLDGSVLVVGPNATGACKIYDPLANNWISAASLLVPQLNRCREP
jgi:hypothetical protein